MRKLTFLFNVFCLAQSMIYAQVGINTSNPSPSSALDIQAPASEVRGVLLPRVSTQERLSITSPDTSLMVFDKDDKLFYYFDGARWVGLLPKEDTYSLYPGGNNPDVSPKVVGNLVIDNGKVQTPNLEVTGFSHNALVPTGAILMWSGPVTNIPYGWKLCDGVVYTHSVNGVMMSFPTPDLRGKFIAGYAPNNSEYAMGNQGGSDSYQLDKSQMPAHQHVMKGDGATVEILSSGGHSHSFRAPSGISDAREFNGVGNNNIGDEITDTESSSHTHPNSSFTGLTGDGTSDGLVGTPIDNRPSYYVLAYIIKLP